MIEEYKKYRCNDNEQPFDWWQFGIVLMIVLMTLGMLTGCKTTKYVSVPEYHTEYIVRSDTMLQKDSVVLHDSVYVYHNGDTIIINKVASRDRWQNIYKVINDTIIKTDSVRVPYPIETKLSKAQQRYLTIGKSVCYTIPIIIGIGVLIVWLIRKKNLKR